MILRDSNKWHISPEMASLFTTPYLVQCRTTIWLWSGQSLSDRCGSTILSAVNTQLLIREVHWFSTFWSVLRHISFFFWALYELFGSDKMNTTENRLPMVFLYTDLRYVYIPFVFGFRIARLLCNHFFHILFFVLGRLMFLQFPWYFPKKFQSIYHVMFALTVIRVFYNNLKCHYGRFFFFKHHGYQPSLYDFWHFDSQTNLLALTIWIWNICFLQIFKQYFMILHVSCFIGLNRFCLIWVT